MPDSRTPALPTWARWATDALLLALHVQPGARRTCIVGRARRATKSRTARTAGRRQSERATAALPRGGTGIARVAKCTWRPELPAGKSRFASSVRLRPRPAWRHDWATARGWFAASARRRGRGPGGHAPLPVRALRSSSKNRADLRSALFAARSGAPQAPRAGLAGIYLATGAGAMAGFAVSDGRRSYPASVFAASVLRCQTWPRRSSSSSCACVWAWRRSWPPSWPPPWRRTWRSEPPQRKLAQPPSGRLWLRQPGQMRG